MKNNKPIGLIGGMSWESTLIYYQVLNREIQSRMGGNHSAHILLHSLDFESITRLMARDDWQALEDIMVHSAETLARAGAGVILICTNTMHRVAPQVAARLDIPLLHIADAAGRALVDQGIDRVGLLGTAYTMEQDFYRKRLADSFGLGVDIPDQAQRQRIDHIIFHELVRGIIRPESQAFYKQVAEDLTRQGSRAILLGCTEIGLLLTPEVTDIPLFDTAHIHARAAVDWALAQ